MAKNMKINAVKMISKSASHMVILSIVDIVVMFYYMMPIIQKMIIGIILYYALKFEAKNNQVYVTMV